MSVLVSNNTSIDHYRHTRHEPAKHQITMNAHIFNVAPGVHFLGLEGTTRVSARKVARDHIARTERVIPAGHEMWFFAGSRLVLPTDFLDVGPCESPVRLRATIINIEALEGAIGGNRDQYHKLLSGSGEREEIALTSTSSGAATSRWNFPP